MQLPRARTTDIIEQEAASELLIYDLQTNTSYILNETSKNVYEACNGEMTFEDLRSRYNYTADLIHFAIDELKAINLIEDYETNHFAGLNRRDVIKKVGLGTMVALPVIAGIIAPTSANAASGTCTTGICIAAGQNICAGCAGRTVTFDLYNAGSGCTGQVSSANFSNNCPANGSALTSGFDRIRKSFA